MPDTELVTLLSRALERHRTRPLFAFEKDGRWARMTYGEVADGAARLRTGLARLGVRAGDRVAIVSKNRVDWPMVMLATHALGASVVPMYEAQHPGDWRHILRDSKARVCFASTDAIFEKLREMLGDLPAIGHLVGLDRDARDDTSMRHLLAGPPADAPASLPSPEDLAAIIYTSGTTGNPKGVELPHRAFAYEATTLANALGIDERDRSVSIFPWAHVGGLCELLFSIDQGACMALPSSIDRLKDTIAATRPTLLAAPPRVWNAFHDAVQGAMREQRPAVRWLFRTAVAAEKKRRARLPLRKRERIARRLARRILFPKLRERLGGAMRLGISGAAALSPAVAELFECIGVQMLEVYGQTETCAISTSNLPRAQRIGSVGRAIDGVRIEIDRSVGDADDGSGEIILHTRGAMRGYHALPDETARVVGADGGICTGDLGKLDRDGYLYITGRVREVYKLENGKFVTPVPLEESLTLSPFIQQAFVWGLNKPHNVALLVASVDALRKWCDAERVGARDAAAILAHARVRAMLEREIAERTAGCKSYERVVRFALIGDPFTTDNGLLTPTLKTKRNAVLSRYKEMLEALYA